MKPTATTAMLVLSAAVMGCSNQLPQPHDASRAPDPLAAFANERPHPSPATRCRHWTMIGQDLEWAPELCDTRFHVSTDPPPFDLDYNLWSREGELALTADAPWKKKGDVESPRSPKPTHSTPRMREPKAPELTAPPSDERVSQRPADADDRGS